MVTSNVDEDGQISFVVYSILYVVEEEPPVIVPVAESITAPSTGASANANEPPWTPVILAVAPSHVAVNSNDELSGSRVVTSNVDVEGHASFVVYSIL